MRFPKPLLVGLLITLFCAVTWAWADPFYPSWWSDYGLVSADRPPTVGQTGYNSGNYSAWLAQNNLPANVGQLKNFATQAQAYLDTNLASVGGAGPGIGNLVANFSVSSATNFSPVNIGQIKAVAQPFYDRLYAVGFNASIVLAANYGFTGNWTVYHYPWTQPPIMPGNTGYNATTYTTAHAAWVVQNYSGANLGHLKEVFSFDHLDSFTPAATLSISNSTIPDWWKVQNGLDPFAGNIDTHTDFGNGRTDLQQFQFDMNIYNGSVSGNLVGNFTSFQTVYTSSSTGSPTVPGDYIPPGNTSLDFPHLPTPQYALIDLGPGYVVDMDDEGDVLFDDSANSTLKLWSAGNVSNVTTSEGTYTYDWFTLANNATLLGRYYNSSNGEWGFVSKTATGTPNRISLKTAAGPYVPGNTANITAVGWGTGEDMVVVRNAFYWGIDATTHTSQGTDANGHDYGYNNEHYMVLCLTADGSVSLTGNVIFDGGSGEATPTGSIAIAYDLATDGASDHFTYTLRGNYTSETISGNYISSNIGGNIVLSPFANYTHTYLNSSTLNGTLSLNGDVISNPDSGANFGLYPPSDAAVAYAEPQTSRQLSNVNGQPVLINPFPDWADNTVYTIKDGNVVTANLTDQSNTTIALYDVSAVGPSLEDDGTPWNNGVGLSYLDMFPNWAFNADLSFNWTALLPSANLSTNSTLSIAVTSANTTTFAADAGNHTVVGIATGLYVDNNRDGSISFDVDDKTSFTNSFRFWINNDIDRHQGVDKIEAGNLTGYDVQDDFDPSLQFSGNLDWKQDTIQGTRDLEDFSRLWISLQGMAPAASSGEIYIGLKWMFVTSDTAPIIKIYSAVESDGGRQYLLDGNTALSQVSNTTALSDVGNLDNVTPTLIQPTLNAVDFVFSLTAFANLTASQPIGHFIFEGCQSGKGYLAVVYLRQNGYGNYTALGYGPGTWIDLKDIKDMYERWTVGDGHPDITESAGNMTVPATSAWLSQNRLSSDLSIPFNYSSGKLGLSVPGDVDGNKYILFVHGWNMDPWARDSYAETAFKRLYWQGYKGKFGAFQWPTTYGYSVNNAPSSFDYGEYTALRSAAPLLLLWATQLGSYSSAGNLYVMAHSHGNLVVGEALRMAGQQGSKQYVQTYAACQAAIPGQEYDPGITANFALTFVVSNISVDGYPIPISGNFGPNTANILDSWVAPAGNTTATGTKVNFYNTADFAMNLWNSNQILKPSGSIGLLNYLSTPPALPSVLPGNIIATDPYGYIGNTSGLVDNTGNYFYKSEWYNSNATLTGSNFTLTLNLTNPQGNITNRYEILAFDAEPRSKAMGEISGNVSGFSFQKLPDATSGGLWLPDTFNTSGNSTMDYSEHPWHSAQFRFDIQSQDSYWNELMKQFSITPNHNSSP